MEISSSQQSASSSMIELYRGISGQKAGETQSFQPQQAQANKGEANATASQAQDDHVTISEAARQLSSDIALFEKENPEATEKELWKYINEKYRLFRPAGMLTLEEAKAKLQPDSSPDPGTLAGWNPFMRISAIGFEEWEQASRAFNAGAGRALSSPENPEILS
jgi:hypothetical protein